MISARVKDVSQKPESHDPDILLEPVTLPVGAFHAIVAKTASNGLVDGEGVFYLWWKATLRFVASTAVADSDQKGARSQTFDSLNGQGIASICASPRVFDFQNGETQKVKRSIGAWICISMDR